MFETQRHLISVRLAGITPYSFANCQHTMRIVLSIAESHRRILPIEVAVRYSVVLIITKGPGTHSSAVDLYSQVIRLLTPPVIRDNRSRFYADGYSSKISRTLNQRPRFICRPVPVVIPFAAWELNLEQAPRLRYRCHQESLTQHKLMSMNIRSDQRLQSCHTGISCSAVNVGKKFLTQFRVEFNDLSAFF